MPKRELRIRARKGIETMQTQRINQVKRRRLEKYPKIEDKLKNWIVDLWKSRALTNQERTLKREEYKP